MISQDFVVVCLCGNIKTNIDLNSVDVTKCEVNKVKSAFSEVLYDSVKSETLGCDAIVDIGVQSRSLHSFCFGLCDVTDAFFRNTLCRTVETCRTDFKRLYLTNGQKFVTQLSIVKSVLTW